MRYPIGISDFKELLESDYRFVDKTLFIREVLTEDAKAFLITRPRRFGKTLNLSMLKYFLDINNAEENRKLFEKTLIANAKLDNGQACMDHHGQYPVIMISLKDLKASSLSQINEDIAVLFSDLYIEHQYLISDEAQNLLNQQEFNVFENVIRRKASAADLKQSIKKLTIYLQRFHGKPVVLLIDEYDTPMHTAYSAQQPYHAEMLEFMAGLLGPALKDNPALHRAVLTGILRISLMNLFSGVNSVPVYGMLSQKFARHFGFEEYEVDKLFKESKIKHDLDEIKSWYNGYQIDGITLYNPWSIISCLSNSGKIAAYWLQTGRSGIVGKALITSASTTVLPTLQTLLDGKSIEVKFDERTIFENIETNENALWSIMLYTGYLKPVKSWMVGSAEFSELKIPNIEIESGIESIIAHWTDLPKSGGSLYTQLLNSLANGDVDAISNVVQAYIYETVSFYDFGSNTEERIYHVFMLGMFLTLKDKYIISSNREAGKGRYDIILIPKNKNEPGLIFELKSIRPKNIRLKAELKKDEILRAEYLQEEAFKAMEQIKDNKYASEFGQHDIKSAVLVGMVFYGKDVVVNSIELNYDA